MPKPPSSRSARPARPTGRSSDRTGAPAKRGAAKKTVAGKRAAAPAGGRGAGASKRSSAAPAKRAGAPAAKRAGAPAAKRSGAPAAKRSGAPAAKRAGAPASKRAGAPAAKRGEARKTAAPAGRGTSQARGRGASARGRATDAPATRGRSAAPGRPRRDDARQQPYEDVAPRKGWGSVARRGAGAMRVGTDAGSESKWDEERTTRRPERENNYVLERVQETKAPRQRKTKANQDEGWRLPDDAVAELTERVGEKRSPRLAKYLKDAARAYAAERWTDVRKALRPLLAETPDAPVVQELNGMLLYRTGKWAAALKELQIVHLATQSFDLYPAMMDAERALKHHDRVDELWTELREASPGPEVMAEGRIVMAESFAEQGRLQDGIRLLEKAARPKNRVQVYHLRSWYALADLYDRAGDTGNARRFFEMVAQQDPDLADVEARLAALD